MALSPSAESERRSSVRPSQAPGRARGFRLRLADVREGEGLLLFGSSTALGGIVGAHVILETARDAIFLARMPPHMLALAYIMMAVAALIVSRLDRAVSQALGRANALILALMSASVGSTIFYLLELTAPLTFLLYLWTGVVGTILTVQFWLFVAARFTAAQGRRLYALIAAGGVLGAVLGGILSQVVTRFGPVKILLPVSALVQLVTAVSLTWAQPARALPRAKENPPLGAALDAVVRDPYLRRLALLSVLTTSAFLVTDYVFKTVVAVSIPKEELGGFLATYYTWLNGAALVVQLFIAMQVLQRAGTIVTLTLLPLALAVGGAATLVMGAPLLIVLVTKAADGALRHSLHRVSSELLFLPLAPADRENAKSLFDTALSRGTQGIVAVLLLVLGATDSDGLRVMGAILALLALLWIGVAVSLRRPYLEEVRRALGAVNEGPRFRLRELTLDSVEVVMEALSSPEEGRVIGAMTLFAQGGRAGLIPALVLYHPSPEVLTRALEILPSPSREDWVPLAERLLSHDSAEVRLAAVRALGRTGHEGRLLASEDADSPRICATRTFFEARKLGDPLEHPGLIELLEERAPVEAQEELVLIIAEFGDERFSDALERLDALERPALDAVLPRAFERSHDPRFIPALIARLARREGRADVRRALVSLGSVALSALEQALHSPLTEAPIRLHIPRAIAEFPSRRAARLLLSVLESDLPGQVRFKALRGLGRMATRRRLRLPPDRLLRLVAENAREALRVAVLADLLEQALQEVRTPAKLSGRLLISLLRDKNIQAEERFTRLLQLVYPREDLRRVYHAFVSGDLASRAAAAELLEVLTLGNDEAVRELVRALSDGTPTRARHEYLRDLLQLKPTEHKDAVIELMSDGDPAIAALAIEFATRAELAVADAQEVELLEKEAWFDRGFLTSVALEKAHVS